MISASTELIDGSAALPPKEGTEYRTIEFTSDGAVLRGRLYLPDSPPGGVVVIERTSQAQASWLTRTLGSSS